MAKKIKRRSTKTKTKKNSLLSSDFNLGSALDLNDLEQTHWESDDHELIDYEKYMDAPDFGTYEDLVGTAKGIVNDQESSRSLTPLSLLEMALSILSTATEDFAQKQKTIPELNALLRSQNFETLPSKKKVKTYAEQLKQIKKAYKLDLPLFNPIAEDFFWSWAMLDLKLDKGRQTLVQKLLAEEAFGSTELMSMFKRLGESQLGIYEYQGYDTLDDVECEQYGVLKGSYILHLQDIINGELKKVYLKERILCEPGQLLLLRIIPLPKSLSRSKSSKEISKHSESLLHVSIQTCYALSASKALWDSYLEQALSTDQNKRISRYQRLMNSHGSNSKGSSLLWLEFIQGAYAGISGEDDPNYFAIFLEGTPNQIDSMPQGDQVKAELIKFN